MADTPPKDKMNVVRGWIKEYLELFLFAIFAAVILRSFVIEAYRIPSGTVDPQFVEGDLVLTYKIPYGFEIPILSKKVVFDADISRGTLFVFKSADGKTLEIRRVLGFEGDHFQINAESFNINGIKIDHLPENLAKNLYREAFKNKSWSIFWKKENIPTLDQVVPQGKIWAVRDNRIKYSIESESNFLKKSQIVGRPIIIWASAEAFGGQKGGLGVRWERLLKSID